MPNIFCLKDVWANGEVGLYLIQIGTSLWTLLLTWNELLQCKVEFGKSHKGYICTFACRSGLVSGSAGLFTPNCLESNSNLSQSEFRLYGCQMFNSSHWLKFNSKGDDLSETAFDWWGSDWASGPLFYTKWLLVQCGKPPVSSTCQATMLLPSFGSHESEILGLSSVCATIMSM